MWPNGNGNVGHTTMGVGGSRSWWWDESLTSMMLGERRSRGALESRVPVAANRPPRIFTSACSALTTACALIAPSHSVARARQPRPDISGLVRTRRPPGETRELITDVGSTEVSFEN